jgi:hypothetical protein
MLGSIYIPDAISQGRYAETNAKPQRQSRKQRLDWQLPQTHHRQSHHLPALDDALKDGFARGRLH